MTTEQKNGATKVLPIVVSVVMSAVAIVSTTLAIAKSREQQTLTVQVAAILLVIDGLQEVDQDLALQFERERGERTAEIVALQGRIENIGRLVDDLKSAVLGGKR